MYWLLSWVFFSTILASSTWIEHYLTSGIHRRLTANSSAVYFTFAHMRSTAEVKKNLYWILDPCGEHESVSIGNRTVACGDNYVKEFVGNSTIVEQMCSHYDIKSRRAGIIENEEISRFEVLWVGEEKCHCKQKCADGTMVEKWPTCNCRRMTYIGAQKTACDFYKNCDWIYETTGFNVSLGKPGIHPFDLAYAVLENTSTPSVMYSPYYTQFTSSCSLGFFYNVAGSSHTEIRIYLEWRKYPGQTSSAEDVLISKLNVHQENSGVLDHHEVRIGFVTKHARIRIECLLVDGTGKGICKFNNLTWNNCAERDIIDSPCHKQNNPTLCSNNGQTVCLEDVTCDGVRDCPKGEDEANCDYIKKTGSQCNFDNEMCGWEEKAFPLRRDGKKLFVRGRMLSNLSVEETDGTMLDSRVMRVTPRNNSKYFLVVSGKGKDKFDSREYYLESPVFPPTKQFPGDINRPEAVCTARFRYCMKGTEQRFQLELEKHAYNSKNWRGNIQLLWEPPLNTVAEYEAGTKCDWTMASVKIPRQTLPFRIRFTVKLMSRYRLPFIAVDDFSMSPWCFDHNSNVRIPLNHSFGTCGKTGTDVPIYDDCRREAVSKGLNEVEVNKDGSRFLTIPKDGAYWMKVCGAAGGSFPISPGIHGNCVTAVTTFEEGSKIRIIVGQRGTNPCSGPTDSLSKRQERIFRYVCGIDNATVLEEIDPGLYIGAGGGGLSGLILPDGKAGIIAAGGGGAFPKIFKKRLFVTATNGNGINFKPNQTMNECNPECADATPKFINDQGLCFKKVPFDTQGGYGGGGASCGTGGGGGGGYFGGKYGRFAPGESGTDYVADLFSTALVGYLSGTNPGEGSVFVVGCSLECKSPSFCDFVSSYVPDMICSCGNGKVMMNDTCVQQLPDPAALSGLLLDTWLILLALLFVSVLVGLIILSRFNYTCLKFLGKTHFVKKNMEKHDEGVELLDYNNPDNLEKLFDNQPFIKNLPNKSLLMLLNRINDNDLELCETIGQGAFGNVSRGILKEHDGSLREVAVKVLNTEWSDETASATRSFITEAILMSMSNNIGKATIQLIGVVLDHRPYKMVMELMKGGNLLNFLRSSRPNDVCENPNNLTMRDLIQFAKDIVEGCLILEKNQHLHRDLAARNCLLTTLGPGRRVKIGDFGLATELYHTGEYVSRARHRPIPLKWMPPEAIQDGIFSTKTDVWSFGVVCWEIFTIGQIPYPTVPTNYLFDVLAQGKRLAKPKGCLTEIYEDLMLECWQPHPENRPSFTELDEKLSDLLLNEELCAKDIPLVYGLEKVSSPILEEPHFPAAGTPVTIETALPTPLGTEDQKITMEKLLAAESRGPSPPAIQPILTQSCTAPAPLCIKNSCYYVPPIRPTELPLSGPNLRESLSSS